MKHPAWNRERAAKRSRSPLEPRASRFSRARRGRGEAPSRFAALSGIGAVVIDDAACVDISFPQFFDLLGKICLH